MTRSGTRQNFHFASRQRCVPPEADLIECGIAEAIDQS
jgi:hypothetical protein